MDFVKRCWAEIDLGSVVYNYGLFKNKLSGGAKIIAVIKANAYGHGANEIARELSAGGCDFFAVSNITEAANLRKYGIRGEILMLGYTPAEYAAQLAENEVYQAVFSREYAELLNERAKRDGVKVKAFLKIDSGMGRLGFDAFNHENAVREIEKVSEFSNIEIAGAFTHFAVADNRDSESIDYTLKQGELFRALLDKVRGKGIEILFEICCNSAAGHFLPALHMNGIRLGISLYGLSPSNKEIEGLPLRQVMTLKTVVSMVKTLPAGRSVSYGRTYICDGDTKVATVCIGYADGYPRKLSNKGFMWAGGRRVPVIGRVCMDQVMLDVTGLDVKMGDEVIVFGDGSDITADELARLTDTINYEITCGISARVPRVYIKGGKVVSVRDNTY